MLAASISAGEGFYFAFNAYKLRRSSTSKKFECVRTRKGEVLELDGNYTKLDGNHAKLAGIRTNASGESRRLRSKHRRKLPSSKVVSFVDEVNGRQNARALPTAARW